MLRQEVFFEQRIGDKRIEVLKTYDQNYAREIFENMDEVSRMQLWKSLGIDEAYEATDIPGVDSQDGADLLWDELIEGSREDGNRLSFFVVNEENGRVMKGLYVAPDWPSAEDFAKMQLAQLH